MSRKKNISLLAAGILIGAALSGPAVQAAEPFLKAFPSGNRFYLDGQQITLPAYSINGSNYVRLRDVGEAMDFNVYWDETVGTVQIDSGMPYTGEAPVPAEDLDAVRQELIRLVNETRTANGAAELAVNDALMAAAQACSDKLYSCHHNKEECETVAAHGYPYGFGSNLTAFTGTSTATGDAAQRAIANWTNSPGHFQTMIDPAADCIGVGITEDGGRIFCCLFVGKPNTCNPYG